jgi:ankyrin repeat protein
MRSSIDRGSDIYHRNFTGVCALYAASFKEVSLPAVEILIERGANVNNLTDRGFSPLHIASQECQLKIVKVLVTMGADINAVTLDGVTPMLSAAMSGFQEIVEYLFKKGADYQARGSVAKACKCCGKTEVPLLHCSQCSHLCTTAAPNVRRRIGREGTRLSVLKKQRDIYRDRVAQEINERVSSLCPFAAR